MGCVHIGGELAENIFTGSRIPFHCLITQFHGISESFVVSRELCGFQ